MMIMEKNIFEKQWRALGTDIYIQIVDDGFEMAEIQGVFLELEKLYARQEKIFSRFDSQSELSGINSQLGEFVEASSDMVYLAKKSLEYFKESSGIFDPRILRALELIGYEKSFSENSFSSDIEYIEKLGDDLSQDLVIDGDRLKFLQRMDFSGIAKGYITDRAADFLQKKGFRNFLVDSGGDMFAAGKNNLGGDWGISLEGAMDENEIVAKISDEAIATSGSVRRNWKIGEKSFHHLIHPHNLNDFSFEL